MKTERLEDGRWSHVARQSWLKQLDVCPERARREMTGEMPRIESDAANIGTAAHTVYECVLLGDASSLHDAVQIFHHEFDVLVALAADTFQWTKYTPLTAHAFGELCVTNWYEQVLPTLETSACVVETPFQIAIWEDEHRTIELSGTIDYWQNPEYGELLMDWKHSGRTHQAWEKKRWDVQSTAYTYAASVISEAWNDPWEFQFVVMHPKGVQRIPVDRGPRDWAWLRQKVLSAAKLVEAEMDGWYKNDASALCSPRYCGAWGDCKGASVGPDPWGQLPTTELEAAA